MGRAGGSSHYRRRGSKSKITTTFGSSLSYSYNGATTEDYIDDKIHINNEKYYIDNDGKDDQLTRSTTTKFIPTKEISNDDCILIDMLNSEDDIGHENDDVCYCITDPDEIDCPIVFVSDGFCNFTGYDRDEIVGRNCRFLQGPNTDPDHVDRIRKAVKKEESINVNLLNYCKNGKPFYNEFFMKPLYDTYGNLAYFIGVQCPIFDLNKSLQFGSSNNGRKTKSNIIWNYLTKEIREGFKATQFMPRKQLKKDDNTIIEMLNTVGHEDVLYCISDPNIVDCPIVFASDGFCEFTGYNRDDIVGRNCRFLQGPDTSASDVDRIRKAVKEHKSTHVNLLNYCKNGKPFYNEFFMKPLYDTDGQLAYFIGVQCPIVNLHPGKIPSNSVWVYLTEGKIRSSKRLKLLIEKFITDDEKKKNDVLQKRHNSSNPNNKVKSPNKEDEIFLNGLLYLAPNNENNVDKILDGPVMQPFKFGSNDDVSSSSRSRRRSSMSLTSLLHHSSEEETRTAMKKHNSDSAINDGGYYYTSDGQNQQRIVTSSSTRRGLRSTSLLRTAATIASTDGARASEKTQTNNDDNQQRRDSGPPSFFSSLTSSSLRRERIVGGSRRSSTGSTTLKKSIGDYMFTK